MNAGTRPIVIEQDVVWHAGRSVVAHEAESAASAPTLEEHFFERVAPMLDRALADGQRADWPLVILHLDFKTNEPEQHAFVWSLLGEAYLAQDNFAQADSVAAKSNALARGNAYAELNNWRTIAAAWSSSSAR